MMMTGTLWLALFGACHFDRTPLVGVENGVRASSPSDPNRAISPALAAVDGGSQSDASDGSNLVGRGPDASTDAGAAMHTTPVVPQVQCNGVFCPVTNMPDMACCTAQRDVQQRAARAPDLCGVDLRALATPAYADSCWQRDRLGIVDDHCPALAAEPGAHGVEPGCCADDGQCGTLDADRMLGCRHVPGSEAQSCGGQPQVAVCDGTGVFGLRLTIDAAWGGNGGFFATLTEASRDKIEIYVLANVTGVDPATSRLALTSRLCGVTLPAFYSPSLCEAYQPEFPAQLWESNALPPLALGGTYTCGATGCLFGFDPTTNLLGVNLENPEAVWPTADQTLTMTCPAGRGDQCFPDQDADGRPGVQVNLLTTGSKPANGNTSCADGYKLRGTPLSENLAAIVNGVRRTDRLQLGTRIRVGGSARFAADCNSAAGSGLAEYVDSRAVGCLVQQGTLDFQTGARSLAIGPDTPCEFTEVRFVDSNLPAYTVLSAGAMPDPALKIADNSVSNGPELSLTRLGPVSAAISCDQVRSANY
jgi:hypothetical protein